MSRQHYSEEIYQQAMSQHFGAAYYLSGEVSPLPPERKARARQYLGMLWQDGPFAAQRRLIRSLLDAGWTELQIIRAQRDTVEQKWAAPMIVVKDHDAVVESGMFTEQGDRAARELDELLGVDPTEMNLLESDSIEILLEPLVTEPPRDQVNRSLAPDGEDHDGVY